MSEQNQPNQSPGPGAPRPGNQERSAGAFIRRNLAILIPVGLVLLFFLLPATRNWLFNKVRCSMLGAKEGAERVEACRNYLAKAGFAGAACYEDCTEAVDFANAKQARTYQALKAYIDKYVSRARTDNYREILALLDVVSCEDIQMERDDVEKAAKCQAYKDEFGQAGSCYEECHAFLDAYDCEAARQASNREEAYRRYVDKYGPEGKCYEAFQAALEKGIPASMDDPAARIKAPATTSKSGGSPGGAATKKAPSSSRVCQTFTVGSQKFRAIKLGPLWWTAENMNKNGFVNWQQARAACPTGWRLPCTQEVEHLIREFYSNPDKAYTYLTSQDPRNCEFNLEFTGFQWTPGTMTTNEGESVGFWCWNEYTPNGPQAGSFLFRKNGRAIETVLNTEKTMGLNCRCVKESKDYQKSSLRFMPCVGMP